MNEPSRLSGINESVPPPVPYKDRRTGLIIFGILTILLGCLAGLFVPLMFLGAAMSSGPNAAPVSSVLFSAFTYGFLAVALVWLGIGSLKARRWARALLLIFSVAWLVVGLVSIPVMAFIMPKAMASQPMAPGQPEVPVGVIMGIMFTVLGIFFVALPGAWTFFYGSRHVKATCEARDPVIRWTDNCPLPVLAVSLWLAFGVPMMLLMPLVGWGVFPFFGTFLVGPLGALLYWVLAGVWAYAAWALYRLDVRGWWVVLALVFIYTVSMMITYARHDMTEMYRLMNYPPAQLEQIEKFQKGITSGTMTGVMGFFAAIFCGYLLFIKRFMRSRV